MPTFAGACCRIPSWRAPSVPREDPFDAKVDPRPLDPQSVLEGPGTARYLLALVRVAGLPTGGSRVRCCQISLSPLVCPPLRLLDCIGLGAARPLGTV